MRQTGNAHMTQAPAKKDVPKDVVPAQSISGAVALRNGAAIEQFISADWIDDVNADEAKIGILDQVFSAQTADEIFADSSALSWRDNADKPYQLTGGVRFLRSDKKYAAQQTVPAFVVVQAVDVETGETVVLTCGAYKVVAQIKQAFETGQMPQYPIVLRSKETRNGFTALSLVKWAEPTDGADV